MLRSSRVPQSWRENYTVCVLYARCERTEVASQYRHQQSQHRLLRDITPFPSIILFFFRFMEIVRSSTWCRGTTEVLCDVGASSCLSVRRRAPGHGRLFLHAHGQSSRTTFIPLARIVSYLTNRMGAYGFHADRDQGRREDHVWSTFVASCPPDTPSSPSRPPSMICFQEHPLISLPLITNDFVVPRRPPHHETLLGATWYSMICALRSMWRWLLLASVIRFFVSSPSDLKAHLSGCPELDRRGSGTKHHTILDKSGNVCEM